MRQWAIPLTVVLLLAWSGTPVPAFATEQSMAMTDKTPSGTLENGVRVIHVTARRYQFDPDPIVVRKGEKVRLILESTDTRHGLAIPAYRINVAAPVGHPESVEFVASKAGTFLAHCSVFCGLGHRHMRTHLIVLE